MQDVNDLRQRVIDGWTVVEKRVIVVTDQRRIRLRASIRARGRYFEYSSALRKITNKMNQIDVKNHHFDSDFK